MQPPSHSRGYRRLVVIDKSNQLLLDAYQKIENLENKTKGILIKLNDKLSDVSNEANYAALDEFEQQISERLESLEHNIADKSNLFDQRLTKLTDDVNDLKATSKSIDLEAIDGLVIKRIEIGLRGSLDTLLKHCNEGLTKLRSDLTRLERSVSLFSEAVVRKVGRTNKRIEKGKAYMIDLLNQTKMHAEVLSQMCVMDGCEM